MHLLHHLANDGQLLEILFTKVGTVGLDDVEQLAHNLADTIEVTRAVDALHHGVERCEAELTRIGLRINLLYRGSKHKTYATSLEQQTVGIERTWVLC